MTTPDERLAVPVPGSEWCFGCGRQNPFGLHPRFRRTDRGIEAEFVARPEHQGFRGLVQGGILAAMLDEAMAHALWAEGVFAVTGRLEVFFRYPTPIGAPLRAGAEIVARAGRKYELRAWLALADGRRTVEGSGTFIELPEGRFGQAD
ncbi:MAG TPA: PaaI family thioesterase [Chloroflexota bacterium]|nr:PaaI family thioesterase [Chloroflexota bacterium]